MSKKSISEYELSINSINLVIKILDEIRTLYRSLVGDNQELRVPRRINHKTTFIDTLFRFVRNN